MFVCTSVRNTYGTLHRNKYMHPTGKKSIPSWECTQYLEAKPLFLQINVRNEQTYSKKWKGQPSRTCLLSELKRDEETIGANIPET